MRDDQGPGLGDRFALAMKRGVDVLAADGAYGAGGGGLAQARAAVAGKSEYKVSRMGRKMALDEARDADLRASALALRSAGRSGEMVGNTGVLPVRIQIPMGGDRYATKAFYVPANRALRWSAAMVSRTTLGMIHGTLWLLALLVGALMVRLGRSLLVRSTWGAHHVLLAGATVYLAAFMAYLQQVPVGVVACLLAGVASAFILKRLKPSTQAVPVEEGA